MNWAFFAVAAITAGMLVGEQLHIKGGESRTMMVFTAIKALVVLGCIAAAVVLTLAK